MVVLKQLCYICDLSYNYSFITLVSYVIVTALHVFVRCECFLFSLWSPSPAQLLFGSGSGSSFISVSSGGY